MKKELEKARRYLYALIETGTTEEIIEASRYLDELILKEVIRSKCQKNVNNN
ncbi:MAG: Spo0E family sporulation regulatory protein-aspartic acid phosphatase [Clostridiaceae bacterium]|nr:Spo0E family sporulation regulatory protein-aspartic acid phosphatase [Clostridiaceae bacterium]